MKNHKTNTINLKIKSIWNQKNWKSKKEKAYNLFFWHFQKIRIHVMLTSSNFFPKKSDLLSLVWYAYRLKSPNIYPFPRHFLIPSMHKFQKTIFHINAAATNLRWTTGPDPDPWRKSMDLPASATPNPHQPIDSSAFTLKCLQPTTFPPLPPPRKSSTKMISSSLSTFPTTPMAPTLPEASKIHFTR